MLRRAFLGSLLGAGALPARVVTRALERATAYLWSQQGADGGWHSATYGLLRSGQSLTPFVLNALLSPGPGGHALPDASVRRALVFLLRHTDPDGAVGRAEPGLNDYPTYATALAVLALSKIRPADRTAGVRPWIAYLRRQQFTEAAGWTRGHPAYGGWGMGGEIRRPPNPGHVDLSMTRFALQALAAAGVHRRDPVFEKASVFVQRCQNFDTDGGFFFSTVVLSANKAGRDGRRFMSYGTATADGILALLAMGCSVEHPRVRAARRWLAANHTSEGAPGFAGQEGEPWAGGLRFYYAAASAEAFLRLGLPQAAGLRAGLRRSQRPDGSWVNENPLGKEDDPLIATALAIQALAAG